MAEKNYTWIGFYEELATRLLTFRDNRAELIGKIKQVYSNIGLKLPKLDKDYDLTDIDPFTVFGLFNKGISEQNRLAIIREMVKEFGIKAALPEAFDGIPTLNNQRAVFHAFKGDPGLGEHDIDNLWRLLAAALELADEDSEGNRKRFSEAYDPVLGQKIIKWNITQGLFWVRPCYYLNLDSSNRDYLEKCLQESLLGKARALLKKVPSAAEYLWLRDELFEAFSSGALKFRSFPEFSEQAWRNKKPAPSPDPEPAVRYWLYAPGKGAEMWDAFHQKGIMAIAWGDLGDLDDYDSKRGMKLQLREKYGDTSHVNDLNALWQFAKEMKPGDVVFAKKGKAEILGKGVVESDYEHDEREGAYPNIRKVRWTHKGSWQTGETLAMKTLTEVTDYTETVGKLLALFENEPEPEPEPVYPSYTKENFLKEAYLGEEEYRTLVGLWKAEKNIILQGAPGVGKTFIAKRLAYSIMGVKDVNRVMMVQFHQSYSYEDFIMGFRPSKEGFGLKEGAFYSFCKRAEEDSENDYFFIIDEINRGNLGKIFGELFMLLEADKRGPRNTLRLLYKDELFFVPENVYIIGMMNTADRSLAMLDYALRRRFAFFELKPGFASEGFRAYRSRLNNARFDRLIQAVEQLNERIASDASLGEGFCIGHSCFCDLTEYEIEHCARLDGIVEYKLIPLLKEYWFDDPAKVKEWSGELRSALR